MGRWVRLITVIVAVGVLTGRAWAVDSLPGDADCDGFVLLQDVDWIGGELFDGDEPLVDAIADGELVSCSGADLNADGVVSVADVIAGFAAAYGQPGQDIGPLVTFLGVASADGSATPIVSGGLVPIYARPGGLGFQLIVEAAPGESRLAVGQTVFNPRPNDPSARPDIQVVFSNGLFEGSEAICDEFGVPPVSPPSFAENQDVANALNDASCRFSVVNNPAKGCTMDVFGNQRFMHPQSRTQFCLAVGGTEIFPEGDTLVTARVLDVDGNPGPVSQILIHVGTGPLPTPVPTATMTSTRRPSFTPTPTFDVTRTFTATATGTATRPLATPTRTLTARPGTRTPTATRTPRHSATPTATLVPTRTRTPSATLGITPGTPTRSPTRTRTVRASSTPTRTGTPTITRVPTLTRTPTVTRTVTHTRTVTRTRTPVATGTNTRTPTITRTPTVTRTMGPTGRPGPDVTFFGIAKPDDRLAEPDQILPNGDPVYVRPFGHGFTIVVEGKPGPSRRPVGRSSFNYLPGDASVLPDLLMIVSRDLGADPTTAVCDNIPPFIGGVPASAGFDGSLRVTQAVNDLGCRFVDGDNQTIGRAEGEACTRFPDGEFRFRDDGSTVQFCAQISLPLSFKNGDTIVTVRLKDTSGSIGPEKRLVVRVQ